MSASRGRIGPNAIVQTAAALRQQVGEAHANALVQGATGRGLGALPTEMVDEVEVNRLVHALATDLDPALFETVLRDAGRRTAEYLMTHRIPRLAQRLMRALPSALALRVLLAGIMGHTWTFAGTASVKIAHSRGRPLELTMRGCPMCRGLHVRAPTCHFYAATLERLLVALVSPVARVIEVRCEGAGDTSCAFALALR